MAHDGVGMEATRFFYTPCFDNYSLYKSDSHTSFSFLGGRGRGADRVGIELVCVCVGGGGGVELV